MAGGRTHKDVLSIFEIRFDHQSARNVLADALRVGGIGAKDAYSDDDLKALAGVVPGLAGRTERLVEALIPPPPPPPAPAPAPAAEPKAAAPAEEQAGGAEPEEAGKDGGKKKKK